MSGDRISLQVPVALAGLRLDQVLQQLLPEYSRSRLQTWIRNGHVTVNQEKASQKQILWGGESLVVEPELLPEQAAFVAEDLPLEIVFEDDTLLVINKPAGLVVHPGSGNWSGTMLNALLHHAPGLAQVPRAGIVHRLDKETSGLLVVAKTLTAQTDLVRQLQARSVHREYLAVVNGRLEAAGTVDAPIGRHPRERTKMAVVATGKRAVTHYTPLEPFAQHTLVRCRLETGRTHQIRVHLQSIGHALAGDPVYGQRQGQVPAAVKDAIAALGRQALHAEQLGLLHPDRHVPMHWQAPLPADMQRLLDVLRQAEPIEKDNDDA